MLAVCEMNKESIPAEKGSVTRAQPRGTRVRVSGTAGTRREVPTAAVKVVTASEAKGMGSRNCSLGDRGVEADGDDSGRPPLKRKVEWVLQAPRLL